MATSASTTLTSWTWIPWLGYNHKFLEWSQWPATLTLWQFWETNYISSEATQVINISKICMSSTRRHSPGRSPKSSVVHLKAFAVTPPTSSVIRYTCSVDMMAEENPSKRSFQAMTYTCWIRTRCVGAILLRMRKHRPVDSVIQLVSSEWNSFSFLEVLTGASGLTIFVYLISESLKKMKLTMKQ